MSVRPEFAVIAGLNGAGKSKLSFSSPKPKGYVI